MTTYNRAEQDSIRDILTAALNKIQTEHGACVTGLTAEWIDVSTCEESKKATNNFRS